MKAPPQAESAFHESVQILLQLHFLMAKGKGDEAEADELRDRAEAPWYRMSRTEQLVVDGLSADLYSLGVDRQVANTASELHIPEVFGPVWQRDWYRALEELRKREADISSKDVAVLRAICWEGIGEPDVAKVFASEAIRVAGSDPKPEAWLLQFLIEHQQLDEALARSEKLLRDGGDALLLLSAAAVFHTCGMRIKGHESDSLIRKAIHAVDIALQQIGKSAAHEEVVKMAPRARLYQSLGYSRLGELQKAIEACDDSLVRNPGNDEAMLLKAWLIRQDDPIDSEAQFREAFASGLGSRMHAELTVSSNLVLTN